MVVMNPVIITRADAERIALRGLQSFFDVEAVGKVLSEKHNVPAKELHFAKMQAQSLKDCLQQALE
jgi:hypothetical protein